MENDKIDFDEETETTDITETENGASSPRGTAPRARNRTVMLSPDVTGQVRARLAQGDSAPLGLSHGGGQTSGSSDGFESPRSMNNRPNTAAQDSYSGYTGPTPAGAQNNLQTPSYQTPPPPYQAPSYQAPYASQQNGSQNNYGGQPYQAAVEPEMGNTSALTFYTKESPLVGFLVSFDTNVNGDVFDLRTGRLIVTSERPASGSYMFVEDDTVSPMHAIVRITGSGEIQVLDQLSEHGTKITRFGSDEEEELSGEKSSLDHGDMIKFGNRVFYVCLLAMPDRG